MKTRLLSAAAMILALPVAAWAQTPAGCSPEEIARAKAKCREVGVDCDPCAVTIDYKQAWDDAMRKADIQNGDLNSRVQGAGGALDKNISLSPRQIADFRNGQLDNTAPTGDAPGGALDKNVSLDPQKLYESFKGRGPIASPASSGDAQAQEGAAGTISGRTSGSGAQAPSGATGEPASAQAGAAKAPSWCRSTGLPLLGGAVLGAGAGVAAGMMFSNHKKKASNPPPPPQNGGSGAQPQTAAPPAQASPAGASEQAISWTPAPPSSTPVVSTQTAVAQHAPPVARQAASISSVGGAAGGTGSAAAYPGEIEGGEAP